MVEILSYGSSFFRCLNNLDFETLNDLMTRIVVPECSLKIYCPPDTLPKKVVPRESISEYFKFLSEAIPDALWRVEDTKLRKGKPRTVVSNFNRSGTLIFMIIYGYCRVLVNYFI